MAIWRKSIVNNVLLKQLVLSGLDYEPNCQNLQVNVLRGSICNHVYSFFGTIILENKTTDVKGTVKISKTNVGVVTKQVKFRSVLIRRSVAFIFRYSNSDLEKKSTLGFSHNLKRSGLLSIFTLLVKKWSDKIVSKNTSRNSYLSQCKTLCIQRQPNWICKKRKIRARTIF